MEYWLSEKGSMLVWALPLAYLATMLFVKVLFKSWVSGLIAGFTVPAMIFYIFWVAGAEDDISILEFFGVLGIPVVIVFIAVMFNRLPSPQVGDNKMCEHKGCEDKATWMIRNHAWGAVSYDHYYCDEHKTEHIDTYKLEPNKDIVRL